MRHEVWTGADEALLGTLRFLAGHRRRDRFVSGLIDAAAARVADGDMIADLEADNGGLLSFAMVVARKLEASTSYLSTHVAIGHHRTGPR